MGCDRVVLCANDPLPESMLLSIVLTTLVWNRLDRGVAQCLRDCFPEVVFLSCREATFCTKAFKCHSKLHRSTQNWLFRLLFWTTTRSRDAYRDRIIHLTIVWLDLYPLSDGASLANRSNRKSFWHKLQINAAHLTVLILDSENALPLACHARIAIQVCFVA